VIRARDLQRRRDIGLVEHFDEKQPGATFDQFRPGRTLIDADAAFRVDAHHGQHVLVEGGLDLLNAVFLVGCPERFVDQTMIGGRQRLSEIAEGRLEPTRLLRKRLQGDGRSRHSWRELHRAETFRMEDDADGRGDVRGSVFREHHSHTHLAAAA